MRRYLNYSGFLLGLIVFASFFSCVEVEDLATPNVASPVLVLLQGTEFGASSPVSVSGTFLELDKSGILDHTVGIDSIPLIGLQIRVFVNQTDEVGSATTDAAGKIEFRKEWADLGISNPTSGRQIRLEFAGVHNEIAFRTYHTVRVGQ